MAHSFSSTPEVKKAAAGLSLTIAICGFVLTVIETASAAPKAEKNMSKLFKEHNNEVPLKTFAKQVWADYKKPIIFGTVTIAGLICSNVLSNKAYSQLASAYFTLDTSFRSYRAEVAKRYGAPEEHSIAVSSANQKIDDAVYDMQQLSDSVDGSVLFFDTQSCEYFVDRPENVIFKEQTHDGLTYYIIDTPFGRA